MARHVGAGDTLVASGATLVRMEFVVQALRHTAAVLASFGRCVLRQWLALFCSLPPSVVGASRALMTARALLGVR